MGASGLDSRFAKPFGFPWIELDPLIQITDSADGIQGYSYLSLIQELMKYVQSEEERNELTPSSRSAFKPHHYFDYIFGTSTGG
jgi:hypothetical protein